MKSAKDREIIVTLHLLINIPNAVAVRALDSRG
jgi:hypothetical protein